METTCKSKRLRLLNNTAVVYSDQQMGAICIWAFYFLFCLFLHYFDAKKGKTEQKSENSTTPNIGSLLNAGLAPFEICK